MLQLKKRLKEFVKHKGKVSSKFLMVLLMLSLCVVGLGIANIDSIEDFLTQLKERRQVLAKKAAYKKQYRDIDWVHDDGSRLKMRIPRKYITKTYNWTVKKPYEWIIMSASYPEFQTDKESRNATTPKMLRIELIEKFISPNAASNRKRSAEYYVQSKKAYLYPTDWGLDHYKPIACLEHSPNTTEQFKAKSEPFRDELTPPDCWLLFTPEQFIPNPNNYVINFSCTPLMQRPDGRGGCTVTSHYRGFSITYIMRRYMIPEWKTVHKAILEFLDQFVINNLENIKTED